MEFNNGNSLRMTEQVDISSCYFTIEETVEPLNKLFWSRFTFFYRTSMLSFGGCLKEPKPIPRYTLDECLNV